MREKLNTFILLIKNKNGEHEQALLRIFFALLIFVYLYAQFKIESSSYATVLLFSEGWLIFSIALTLHILVDGMPSRNRQILSMLADISAVTYGMYLTQEGGVIFYGVYLWVIVGNGLRNGIQSLTLAYLFSLVGFTTVILFNPYWWSHIQIAAGLMIPLALIPLYIMKLRNQLNRATEEAKEASLAKSHFLAHMSHEMRTPLNGIIGANDLLIASSLNAEQHDLALTLENSSRILRQMVDNVLDISKIESGKLVSERTDFDLHELANSIVTMFHTQAQGKGLELAVRFTPDTPYALHGDAQHLLQVIVNLVGNALKFTHAGRVVLRISTVHQDRQLASVRFEVIDTGIGIAPEAQQGIFERFTQANASIALKYGGTGLGTTISRDLVKLMGGVIGLNSVPGEGSVFWFELPLAKEKHSPIIWRAGMSSTNTKNRCRACWHG
jgi:two-component system sensor histidine kinase RpfC